MPTDTPEPKPIPSPATTAAPEPPVVVLVRPREEGNIGSVARAMANMGLSRLLLVEPAPALGGVARGFGVGGWEILDRVERYASFEQAIAPYQRLVGTTSARQRPLAGARHLAVEELRGLLTGDPAGTATALVFGPEDSGLTRDELDHCNPVVTISCAPTHPTLNLAQAVLVVAWELARAAGQGRRPERQRPAERPPAEQPPTQPLATAAERAVLRELADPLLERIGYDQGILRHGILRDLGRLATRAEMNGREARLLRRILDRLGGRDSTK